MSRILLRRALESTGSGDRAAELEGRNSMTTRYHIGGTSGSGETIEIEAELPDHISPGTVIQLGDVRVQVYEVRQEIGV